MNLKKSTGEIVFVVGITAAIVLAMLAAGSILSPEKAGSGTGFTVRVSAGKRTGPRIKDATVSYMYIIGSTTSSLYVWEQVVTTATTDVRGYATLDVKPDEVTTGPKPGFDILYVIQVEHPGYSTIAHIMDQNEVLQMVSRRRVIKIALSERSYGGWQLQMGGRYGENLRVARHYANRMRVGYPTIGDEWTLGTGLWFMSWDKRLFATDTTNSPYEGDYSFVTDTGRFMYFDYDGDSLFYSMAYAYDRLGRRAGFSKNRDFTRQERRPVLRSTINGTASQPPQYI